MILRDRVNLAALVAGLVVIAGFVVWTLYDPAAAPCVPGACGTNRLQWEMPTRDQFGKGTQ